ncbi:MAG: methylmalonyl Co-A mutase-associated GTPase MeaB [Acidimicrobiales bacterium]
MREVLPPDRDRDRDRDPPVLFEAARGGDRVALARLLSLVERGGEQAQEVAALSYRTRGDAYSIGITGVPGAGKSTLTDRLVTLGREHGLGPGNQVGVIAVDPSSPFSGGAILGDRVRMPGHALDDGVFIRSMAARGHLGGLSVAVPDAIRVYSAVGMAVVLVETVGVGQQEVDVAAATDTTLVVVNPGWGDAIQANKAGLLEIADMFVINKSDRPDARRTRQDLELMLDLTEPGDWRPPILDTVATTGEGVGELWTTIERHRDHLIAHGTLDALRRRRVEREFRQIVVSRVVGQIDEATRTDRFAPVVSAMLDGDLDPYEAAGRLLAMLPEGQGTGRESGREPRERG